MSAWSEARAGIHSGALAAIQSLTHGIIAFGALGAAGVAFGLAAALAVSAVAGVCVAWLGRSRPLVGTTTAATALVIGTTLTAAAPASLGQAVAIALPLVLLGGALMLLFAMTGVARLAALIPTPVSQGLANATAVLVIWSQAPLLLGGAPGAGWHAPSWPAIAVAALAFLLVLRPWRGLPAPLLALLAATLLHHALAAAGVAVGPVVGTAPSPALLAEGLRAGAEALLTPPPLLLLLPAALTLALLATVETLAAAAALREASGHRADFSADLRGAGTGMMLGAACGGMAASGLTLPSMACWRAGGRGRAAQLWRAATALALLLLGGALLAVLPLAALAGVLSAAVLRLVQLPASPFAATTGRARRTGDALIVLAVVVAAAGWGLVAAVGAGVLLAVLVFTASMAQSPVRRIVHNPVGRSRIRRPPEQERRLRAAGEAVVLIELEGAIFFGSAEHVLQRVEAECATGARVIILDLSRVTRIDLSGGRRLLALGRGGPARVLLAPLHATSAAHAELHAIGLADDLPRDAACPDVASAVELAEALLLRALRPGATQGGFTARAALEALGLPPLAVGPLLALGIEEGFEGGATILRAGDPADAAFLLLEGEVLISLPAGTGRPATRLAVLVPGVVFGESALLGQMRRSADVTARGAVRCLRLDSARIGQLREQSPITAWHLMAVIARQLSAHVTAANATIDRLEA